MATVPTPARMRALEQREAILELVRAHKGRSVAIMKSVARGEDDADSDIELFVDFEPSSSLTSNLPARCWI